jgi:hypothetical protein
MATIKEGGVLLAAVLLPTRRHGMVGSIYAGVYLRSNEVMR